MMPDHRRSTADLAPGFVLHQRQAWLLARQRRPGAYVIGLPAQNPRLRARLLHAAYLLSRKRLHVELVDLRGPMTVPE